MTKGCDNQSRSKPFQPPMRDLFSASPRILMTSFCSNCSITRGTTFLQNWHSLSISFAVLGKVHSSTCSLQKSFPLHIR